MYQSKEKSQSEKGIDQTNCKMQYQTPELTEYGAISEIIQHFPGAGSDGDSFVDCTRS